VLRQAPFSRREALLAFGAAGLALLGCGRGRARPARAGTRERPKPRRPQVLAFDVLETLFALEPLRAAMVDAGLPPESLPLFLAQTLRDGMALDASGTYRPLSEVATSSLEVTMASFNVRVDQTTLAGILARFVELPPHPDVRPAFERARDGGLRILTLTTGSAANTRTLLARAGLLDLVELTISIDEVRHWKPHREVYLHAARTAGVEPARLALVSAQAWDIHGARRAGLVTGWIRRQDARYPSAMRPPDVRGSTLVEVVGALLALPEGEPGVPDEHDDDET
jgi:2-haloacid dehalogenase